MLVTCGEHRFNLLNVTQLRKLTGTDNSLPAHLHGEVCFNDGGVLRIPQPEYEAVCKVWDSHSEHAHLADEKPDTLPMPAGQSEREFNLGDE